MTDFDFTSLVGDDGDADYTYDDTSQLTGADYDFQTDESYTYDDNGNRTNTGYATGFTTRRGLWNLATTGNFGTETWGFGLGWMMGTPSISMMRTGNISILSVWSRSPPALVKAFCFCPPVPKRVNAAGVKQAAKEASLMYHDEVRERIRSVIPFPFSIGSKGPIENARWKPVY